MIDLGSITKNEISITGCQETHPTAGYRRWSGIVISNEPFVAFFLIENDKQISWVRSSYTSNEQKISILFSPQNDQGKDVSVSFSVGDSVVCEKVTLNSSHIEPNPIVGNFNSGSLLKFADLESEKQTILSVIFLSKSDVKIGRKGIWHLKPEFLDTLDEEWRKAFTFGRTGIINKVI